MLTRLLVTMIVVFVAVLIASRIMPGVQVKKTSTALVVALVFGLLNLAVSWLVTVILAVALLPAALLTLGLIYLFLGFLVNTVLLWITDKLLADFRVRGLGTYLGTAAIISVSGWLVTRLL